jgi:uncharacterized membrane protein YgcG
MHLRKLPLFAVLIGAAAILPFGSSAQDNPAVPPSPQNSPAPDAVASLPPDQLDQLVAPVALYDDALLADVLTASTYPLEVVEAHRWVGDPANSALTGEALANALTSVDWDPSVKALVPFPDVLADLDNHLEWTERLGEAFIAQQGDVMDAVQRLRHRAQVAGTLKTSPQQAVASDGDDVTISPPPSDVIFVPTYDPWCAYGAWPYQIYGPYYYAPWSGACDADDYGIAFDAGLLLPFGYWDWGYFDWRGRRIRIRRDRYDAYHSGRYAALPDRGLRDRGHGDDVWRHDPAHRAGVPYLDPRNERQFPSHTGDGESFRGYDERTSPFGESHRMAPAFESFGSGRDAEFQSQRGQISRGGGFGGFSAAGGHFGGGGGHGGGGHR